MKGSSGEMEQGRAFQPARWENRPAWTERPRVSERGRGATWSGCGRDAGPRRSGAVETVSAKVWAGGAAGCTEGGGRASARGSPEA